MLGVRGFGGAVGEDPGTELVVDPNLGDRAGGRLVLGGERNGRRVPYAVQLRDRRPSLGL